MNKKQHGVTLIELTVVLLILVALAGLVSPYVGGTGQKAMCEATDVSMQNIKKVIMENYYVDTLGYYPKNSKDKNTMTDYNLTYLFQQPAGWNKYDSTTKVGWRSDYLQSGLQLSTGDVGKLNASFTDATATPPSPNTEHINNDLAAGNVVLMDAWFRPIILQVPTISDCKTILGWTNDPEYGYCARLVSAGSGNGVGIENATIDTSLSQIRQQDDRILYLNTTPSGEQNTPCDQY
jgi:prepilin-type N-terminal cleavage/methylation domain-containing protein